MIYDAKETVLTESNISSEYEFINRFLIDLRNKGDIEEAYYYGSLVHTPKIPGDIDVLVLFSKEKEEMLYGIFKENLKEHPNIQINLYTPEKLQSELNESVLDKINQAANATYNLMRVASSIKEPHLAKLVRCLGLRAITNKKGISSIDKLNQFKTFSEELEITNQIGYSDITNELEATEFIDSLINEQINQYEPEWNKLSFDHKLAKAFEEIKTRLTNDKWKSIANSLVEINSNMDFAERIFTLGVINLDGQKIYKQDIIDQHALTA